MQPGRVADEVDIVSVLVIAASENQTEILNALVRAQGTAVRTAWARSLEDWRQRKAAGAEPEVVFYFSDLDQPTLDETLAEAAPEATPVIVVGREYSSPAAAAAIDAGAADFVSTDDGNRVAAVLRRECRRRGNARRLLELERQVAQERERLHGLIAGSQNAIAHVHDGVVVDINPAWAERFGYPGTDALSGVPVMDLVADSSRKALKGALRTLERDGEGSRQTLVLRGADGGEQAVEAELAAVESNGQALVEVKIEGSPKDDEVELRVRELEERIERFDEDARRNERYEADENVMRPAAFAPLASERLMRPLSGTRRAIVAFQPADIGEARRLFGPLGVAQIGPTLSAALSPCLAEGDMATRVHDLALLCLVERTSVEELESWAKSTVDTVSARIFEAGGRSGHLALAAGYAGADRLRRLDALCRQALGAMAGAAPGSVSRARTEPKGEGGEQRDTKWEEFIPEALRERRFAIAMRPIEELARGAKLFAVGPRLLDRDGKEVGPELFYGAARRIGLLENLDRRLVGYAFVAQMHMQHNGDASRMLVPLSAAAMEDGGIPALVSTLAERTQARAVAKRLVLEFATEEVSARVRAAERFAREIGRLGCRIGLREFVPNGSAERLIDDLPLASLRLAAAVTESLSADEALAARVRALNERAAHHDTLVIASAVADANTMALLYNLGVGTIEGPVIGEPRLFTPSAGEEPLFGDLARPG